MWFYDFIPACVTCVLAVHFEGSGWVTVFSKEVGSMGSTTCLSWSPRAICTWSSPFGKEQNQSQSVLLKSLSTDIAALLRDESLHRSHGKAISWFGQTEWSGPCAAFFKCSELVSLCFSHKFVIDDSLSGSTLTYVNTCKVSGHTLKFFAVPANVWSSSKYMLWPEDVSVLWWSLWQWLLASPFGCVKENVFPLISFIYGLALPVPRAVTMMAKWTKYRRKRFSAWNNKSPVS